MTPIEFKFYNKSVYLRSPNKDSNKYDQYNYKNCILTDTANEEKVKEVVLKTIRRLTSTYREYQELSDIELMEHLYIVNHPKSNTYPKFNNESKFKAFNKYNNPEIIAIRWNGQYQEWQYQLKNVGHVYDFHAEKDLQFI